MHSPSPFAAFSHPAGAFALCAGRVMALTPQQNTVLRISQGGAWVTLPSQPGDHFLAAGDSLRVPAGDALVLEPWHMPANETLYFDWDPVPMQIAAVRGVAVQGSWLCVNEPSGMSRAAWVQPLADLRAALVLAGRATALAAVALPRLLGALVVGLARWIFAGALSFATNLVAGRAYPAREAYDFFFADEAERAFIAQSRASRAQLRMASCESMASSGAL